MKYVVVVAEFNSSISDRMLEECLRGFKEKGIEPKVVKVPGAVEVPLAARMAIDEGAGIDTGVRCVVALGCVIKGETDHYRAVCDMCSRGIMDVMLATGVPIVFEVLMVDSLQKAEARIDKGYYAAGVAIGLG